MARATTPKTDETPAVAPVEAAVVPVEAAPEKPAGFDWGALEEAKPQEYVRTAGLNPRKDYEKDTPDPIKARVLDSYNAYQATLRRKLAEGISENTAPMHARMDATRVQPCVSDDQAGEFLRLAKAYAKFKGYTLRGEVVKRDEVNDRPAKVVYVVKPMERRERAA